MSSRARIVVSGLIAQYPLGGLTWHYLHYVLGLKRLGHDVYYLEDTGQWPYNPDEGGVAKGCEFNVRYLADLMERFGLGDKWAYRFPWKSRWFGLSEQERKDLLKSADLLINVSGVLRNPRGYREVQRLIYIDSDPVFTQVKLARGQKDFESMVSAHDVHFSFGEAFSRDEPNVTHNWRPTRQPIVLTEWHPSGSHHNAFTTVMNWTSFKPIVYEDKVYGQKDLEFGRFLDLPARVAPTILELAINEGKTRRTPRELLAYKGWRVVDPAVVCPDLDSYRTYVQSSKGEWSVAKNAYVAGQPGWFSDRSACYLAAGRPVVLQETGFSKLLPTGEGLLSFSTLEEATDAIREVEGNYPRHAKAARAIAEAYFDSDSVLTHLIDDAMSDHGENAQDTTD